MKTLIGAAVIILMFAWVISHVDDLVEQCTKAGPDECQVAK